MLSTAFFALLLTASAVYGASANESEAVDYFEALVNGKEQAAHSYGYQKALITRNLLQNPLTQTLRSSLTWTRSSKRYPFF